MLEIEFAEPKYSTCECCGGSMTNLTRFVARDGQPIAIYHATFADSHPESGVLLAVGIGADWNEVESCERVAFACRLWINGDDYVTTIMDRADSPWSQSKVLGRMLDRGEALSNEWLDDLYHLTDHILAEDDAIKSFFEKTIH